MCVDVLGMCVLVRVSGQSNVALIRFPPTVTLTFSLARRPVENIQVAASYFWLALTITFSGKNNKHAQTVAHLSCRLLNLLVT